MRKWLHISVALFTSSLGFVGCGEDFPPPSAVENLRVLAIAADPPEVTDPGFSEVSALVVGAEGEVSYRWEFCPVPGPDILGLVCLVPELSCLLGQEETASVFIPPLDDFLLSPDFSELYIDMEEGIEVQIRLTVTDTNGSCDDGGTCADGYRCVERASLETDKLSCEDLFGLSEDPMAGCFSESCGGELSACMDNEDCQGIFTCLDACGEDDQSCEAECVSAAPALAGELFLEFLDCGTTNGCFELEEPSVDESPAEPAEQGSVCVRQEEAVKGLRVARREQLNTNPSMLRVQLEADPEAEPVVLVQGETKEVHIVPPTHPMDQDLFYLFQKRQLPFSAVVAQESRETFEEDGVERFEDLFISWFTDLGGLESERTGEFNAEPRGEDVTQKSEQKCSEAGASVCAFPNEWKPPSLAPGESREGSIWAVIRDGRGGSGWLTHRVRVEAEP